MPAKDKQGIQRGKCNVCDECEEYTPPKVGARCDYCNHTPVEHVKIIQLGACKCGECTEYDSSDKNSYTDCQYCECKATDHAGAEKMRKKKPDAKEVEGRGEGGRGEGGRGGGRGGSPPISDKCKNPECLRPCFVDENGKKHDYCGRTCASKGLSMMGPGVSPGGLLPRPPTATQPLPHHQPPSFAPFLPPPLIQSLSGPSGAIKLCAKCGLKPSNAGYKWCESCFTESKET